MCMTNPSQLYSNSYMPGCLNECTFVSNVNNSSLYNCNNNNDNNNNNNGLNSVNMYIPRGGWLAVGMEKDKNLLQSMKNTPSSSSIINSSAPFSSKQINVTKNDGSPIYIANKNSTEDINTWTKLQDLCVKNI